MAETTPDAEGYPGERLGLPEIGLGSLASWRSRIAALIVDWATSMGVAVLLFGRGVLTESDWRAWMALAVFFVQSGTGTLLFSGSIGQLLAKIAVVRVDREPLGPLRAYGRAALVCLVLPALVISTDRRGLQDLLANTVVINRR
ncbi:MAG TPA: RDD family protein [Microlunatus sp.]|nr:RDD family protein [Microlunatus sp.]